MGEPLGALCTLSPVLLVGDTPMPHQQLSLPIHIPFANGSNGVDAAHDPASSAAARFPHTRAQLAELARQYKPQADDENTEDAQRVPPSHVVAVASLLLEEKEEDLKEHLRETYGMDDDTVGSAACVRSTRGGRC